VKVAALVMVLLVVAHGSLCVWKGGGALLADGLRAGGRGALQLVPLLAAVFLLVAAWLSDAAGARGLVVAWVAGALTPGGGPVGLPLAAALMRSGAGIGVVVTYVTSMSLLSFVRVPLELGTYGEQLTVLRVLSCVLLPPIAGVVARLLGTVMGW
jgi:hypothetical protein